MALNFLNDGYFAGKVGIGAPAASKKLEVTGNAGIEGTLTVETSSNNIRLLDSNDATVNFSVGVNGKFQIRDVSAVTNPFQIEKAAPNDSLYIKADGNVGIGTSDPQASLHVYTSDTTKFIGTNADYVANSAGSGVLIATGASTGNTYSQIYAFQSGNTAYANLVVPGGNVGIGTTNPAQKFVVADATNGNGIELVPGAAATIQNYNRGTSSYNNINIDTNSARIRSLDSTSFYNGTFTSESMRILSNGNVGIGTTSPSQKLTVTSTTADNATANTVKISHSRSDTDVPTNALYIDMNLSGADTTTADRTNRGIFIDIDSSADGDGSNEHRIRGVNSDVRFTGFSDVVQSGFFYAESNNNTEKTAQLVGVYGSAVHDSSTTNGGVSNMYGVFGQSDVQDLGDVDNAFGGFFQVNIGGARGSANVGVTKGVEGQINIDKDQTIDYNTMTAVSAIIDNNSTGVPNFGNQFLFKGDYQGGKGANAYGIYCEGDKHYLQGSLGISTSGPTQVLHVVGNARVTGAYYDSSNSPGTANQVLISTVTGTDWVDGSAIPGVPGGSGTLNTIPLWTPDGDTLGNSPITVSGSNVLVSAGLQILRTSDPFIQFYEGSTNVGDVFADTSLNNIVLRGASGHGVRIMSNAAAENSETGITLTTANNVGIGTNNPGSLLSLRKDDNTVYDPTSDDGQRAIGPTILLNNNSTTTNTFGQIMYDTDFSGQGVARIVFLDAGTASSAIAFVTEQSDSIGERMRIDPAGNVGIGTDSPGAKLHVRKGGTTAAQADTDLIVQDSTAASSTAQVQILGGASGFSNLYFSDTSAYNVGGFIYNHSSNYLATNVNGSERMRITSVGNVGIGTTTPAAPLDVNGVTVVRGGSFSTPNDARTDAGLVIAEEDFIYTLDASGAYLRRLIGKASDVIQIGEPGTSLIDGINLKPGTSGGYVQMYC